MELIVNHKDSVYVMKDTPTSKCGDKECDFFRDYYTISSDSIVCLFSKMCGVEFDKRGEYVTLERIR